MGIVRTQHEGESSGRFRPAAAIRDLLNRHVAHWEVVAEVGEGREAETHRARTLQKLEINTAELVLYAIRQGVIS